MKTVRAAMLVLAFFTLACAGSRVKYELLDSGAPTSGRDSDGADSDGEDSGGEDSGGEDSGGEDSGGEDSGGDGDSDLDEPYTHWYGVQRFSWDFSPSPGNRECDMIWNLTGTPAAVGCPDCLFTFDLTFNYDTTNSVSTETCSSLATDLTYTYGYVEDYYGSPAVMIPYNYYGTTYWFAFADAEFDPSADTLKYTSGYVDYAYRYGTVTYYFTRYYTGEALLTR